MYGLNLNNIRLISNWIYAMSMYNMHNHDVHKSLDCVSFGKIMLKMGKTKQAFTVNCNTA